MSTRLLTRMAVVLLALLAPAALRAQMSWESQLVDPVVVSSPSGAWTLSVDPGSPRGEGPTAYRLVHGEAVAWSGDLLCVLRDVVLGDDGAFAGTATTADGGLRLMLVGPDGKARFDTTLAYEASIIDGPTLPSSHGVLVDGTGGQVVFRVIHELSTSSVEDWRPVTWATGEALPAVSPQRPLEDPESTCWLSAVRAIPGLPLLVCQWAEVQYDGARGGPSSGTRFVVTDLQAHAVWELPLPHDFEAGGDEKVADALWEAGCDSGVLSCAEARRFAVQLVADAQRVTFEVSAEPGSDKGWSVREVGREKHALETGGRGALHGASVAGEAAAASPLPALALDFLGAIELQAGTAAPREFQGFDIDDRGRLGRVLGGEGVAPRFELRDAEGAVLASLALPIEPKQDSSPPAAIWLAADRWLVHQRTYGEGEREFAWWLDLPAGTLTALPDLDSAPIETCDGSFDGGFVALTSKSAKYTLETALCSFDAAGRLRWRVVADDNTAQGLFSPEDLRVGPQGEIGVLDVIRHEVQRFDAQGVFLGALPLDAPAGHKLSYPNGLAIDEHGDWIVSDFQGKPPVLRVSRRGELLSSFAPHFGDGHEFAPRDGIHVAPDGSLWATDGYALLRLDAGGAVERILGLAPDAGSLGNVECAFVDPQGRVALADKRTHAVHVFDRSGARVAVCTPPADALDDGGEVACLAITPDGHLHAGLRHSGSAHDYFSMLDCDFDASGAHQRDEVLQAALHVQPAGVRRWVTGFDQIRLLEADGSCAKTIARSPDNRWLSAVGEPGVAPDGALAVCSRGSLHIFAPDGAPVLSVPLPGDVPSYAHVAFTGPRVYLGFGASLWRVDLASRAILATKLGAELSPQVSAPCAWRADVGELLVVDEAGKRVLRYRDTSP